MVNGLDCKIETKGLCCIKLGVSRHVPRNMYRGADKSLTRPDWKNNWKVATFPPTRRWLLPRRPGWTDNTLNFLFWVVCKVRVWSLQLVCFLVGLRTYQHPGTGDSVALVRERTIPIERPPPVGEVSANLTDKYITLRYVSCPSLLRGILQYKS